MTATKVLTDMLAAGLMSAELLAAICFLGQKKRSLIVLTALLGAAAAGTRPQLFPVVAVVLGIPLEQVIQVTAPPNPPNTPMPKADGK